MTTNVAEFIDVRARLRQLGCDQPNGFALLPTNFESANSISEFRQVSEAATVKTLFREARLPHSDIVDKSQRPPYIQNNALEWMAPTVFITAGLISQNPECVAVALSTIANYATDFFKGFSGERKVKLEVVVERSKKQTCKKITYEGPPEGLHEIAGIIEATKDE